MSVAVKMAVHPHGQLTQPLRLHLRPPSSLSPRGVWGAGVRARLPAQTPVAGGELLPVCARDPGTLVDVSSITTAKNWGFAPDDPMMKWTTRGPGHTADCVLPSKVLPLAPNPAAKRLFCLLSFLKSPP